MNVCDKYRYEIRHEQPIEYAGLQFQMLHVSDYALFLSAKPSFELMQASLPPQLARLSWMPCLDALDREAEKTLGVTSGYLMSAIAVIKTALGFDEQSSFKISRNEKGNISAALIQKDKNCRPVLLKMQEMRDIREIIAAQNGYEIPDENWNIDLYRAQKTLQEKSDNEGLNVSLDELVYSVSVNTGESPEKIWDWSLKKFFGMQRAVDRKLNYIICGLAETAAGAKFTKGNPYPTWKISRIGDKPSAFKSIEEIEGKAGRILNSPDITKGVNLK